MLVCQPSPHTVVFVNVSKPLQVPRVHIVYQWYLEGFIGIHEEDVFGLPFESRAWLRCGGQAQRAMATQHLRAANAMKQYNGAMRWRQSTHTLRSHNDQDIIRAPIVFHVHHVYFIELIRTRVVPWILIRTSVCPNQLWREYARGRL